MQILAKLFYQSKNCTMDINKLIYKYIIMEDIEKELLNDESKLSFMNNLLSKYQFSEDFLIKTILYYDSWKCLRSQKNLSPYFCFRYLYDNETDSADDWTDYNQIYDYLKKRNYSDEEIEKEFKKATIDRL
jgi:hypothetical protein